MRGFWKREDKLERELRAQRPEPRAEFMQSLESRVVGKAYRRPARSFRLGLAAALTVGMLVALASFGGLSYAATGVSHAVKAATHVVAPAHQAKVAVPSAPLSSAQAQYLVAMCFFGHTIYIDSRAAKIVRALGAQGRPVQGRPARPADGDEGRLHQGEQRPGQRGERSRPGQGEEGHGRLLQEVAASPLSIRTGRLRPSRSRYGEVAADTRAGAATLRATKLEVERRTSR